MGIFASSRKSTLKKHLRCVHKKTDLENLDAIEKEELDSRDNSILSGEDDLYEDSLKENVNEEYNELKLNPLEPEKEEDLFTKNLHDPDFDDETSYACNQCSYK